MRAKKFLSLILTGLLTIGGLSTQSVYATTDETQVTVKSESTLDFINKNADRSLLGNGDLIGINKIELATTMYDAKIGHMTLNEFMLKDDDGDGYTDYLPYLLGQFNTTISVFAVSPDSEWAVARVDLMDNATITDWDGGRNDDSGTSWKDQMKFDQDKGLLYMPTKFFTFEKFVENNAVVQNKNTKEDIENDIEQDRILLNAVRIQLFYAVRQQVDGTEVTIGNSSKAEVITESIYQDVAEYNIGSNRTIKQVVVNGGQMPETEYEYDNVKGILSIKQPPATITDVQIEYSGGFWENLFKTNQTLKVQAQADTIPTGTTVGSHTGHVYTWDSEWYRTPIEFYGSDPYVNQIFDLTSENNYVPEENREHQQIVGDGWSDYATASLVSGVPDMKWMFNEANQAELDLIYARLYGGTKEGTMCADPTGNQRTSVVPEQTTKDGIHVAAAKFLLRCMHYGVAGDFSYYTTSLNESVKIDAKANPHQPNVRAKIANIDGDTLAICLVVPSSFKGPDGISNVGQSGIGFFKVKWIRREKKKMTISKKDIAGNEVHGAKLTVKDASGSVIDEWISTTEPHEIGIIEGNTYTLTETNAPGGMNYAETITFTAGEGIHIDMKDTVSRVYKKDSTGGLLAGATLQITDADGNVKDEWVTRRQLITDPANPSVNKLTIPHDGAQSVKVVNNQLEVTYADRVDYFDMDSAGYETGHRTDNLKVNQEYTLKEVKAPEGYAKAEPLKFTPSPDKDIELTMKDLKNVFHKQDVTGEEIPGAHITITDPDGKVVDEFISTNEPHPLTDLEIGKKYTLREEIAPGGYVTANSIEFTVGEDTEIFMVDTVVVAEKTDSKGNLLAGAKMQVLSEDKKTVIDEWVTGQRIINKETKELPLTVLKNRDPSEVANVELLKDDTVVHITYTDKTEEFYDIDEDGYETTHRIRNLSVANDGINYTGKYYLHEVEAPAGYLVAKDILFEPKTAENVTVTMKDTSVKMLKVDDDNRIVKGAKLRVENKKGEVVEEWTTGQHIADITKQNISEVETQGYSNLSLTANIGVEKKTLYQAIDVLLKYKETGEPQTLVTDDYISIGKEENLEKSDYIRAIFQKLPVSIAEYQEMCKQASEIVAEGTGDEQRTKLREMVDTAYKDDVEYVRATLRKSEESKGGYIIQVVTSDNTNMLYDVDEYGDEAGHRLAGFETGTEYILTEVASPAGYEIAPNMTFTIDEDMVDLAVTMTDKLLLEQGTAYVDNTFLYMAIVATGAVFSLVCFSVSRKRNKQSN